MLALLIGAVVAWFFLNRSVPATASTQAPGKRDESANFSLGSGLADAFAGAFSGGAGALTSTSVEDRLAQAAQDKHGFCGINGCGAAVADVFRQAGLGYLLPTNPDWVPNWSAVGIKIPTLDALIPGDVVIYNTHGGTPNPADGGAGYDHIGIYAGGGRVYNDATSAGYDWEDTTIPIGQFQEGRRL